MLVEARADALKQTECASPDIGLDRYGTIAVSSPWETFVSVHMPQRSVLSNTRS